MRARNFDRKIVAAATLWATSLPAASFAATDTALLPRNLSPWGMFVNADIMMPHTAPFVGRDEARALRQDQLERFKSLAGKIGAAGAA